MYKTFRIIFACAAAAAAAASVFLGIFLGIVPFFCCVIGAVFFFAMSMLFKFLQEDKEKKNAPETPEIPSVGAARRGCRRSPCRRGERRLGRHGGKRERAAQRKDRRIDEHATNRGALRKTAEGALYITRAGAQL